MRFEFCRLPFVAYSGGRPGVDCHWDEWYEDECSLACVGGEARFLDGAATDFDVIVGHHHTDRMLTASGWFDDEVSSHYTFPYPVWIEDRGDVRAPLPTVMRDVLIATLLDWHEFIRGERSENRYGYIETYEASTVRLSTAAV